MGERASEYRPEMTLADMGELPSGASDYEVAIREIMQKFDMTLDEACDLYNELRSS